MIEIVSVTMRYGHTADWAGTVLVLGPSEWGVDIDTGIVKIGDGLHMWPELAPMNSDMSGQPSDSTDWPDLTLILQNGMT